MNVLITGASGGLGRALAGECARRGYNMLLTDLKTDNLLALKHGLECQYPVSITVKACDLTADQNVDDLLMFTDQHNLRFDMLLNVAGIDHEGGFLSIERQKILDIVNLDIIATLRITHGLLERRRPGKPFYILFVSSLASLCPMPFKATYAASKRFLLDFSIALNRELQDQKVHVMALCPAGLATTHEALQGIAAQGFWGQITTCHIEIMVRMTISHLLCGRHVYIPGTVNRILSFFGKLVPPAAASALVYSRWQKS
ncbi:MAG TPA: short-chain dehydrogenase [Clostridiales bacterium]|nr:short-chain dehydrogenase [Clostridiales bacterium]